MRGGLEPAQANNCFVAKSQFTNEAISIRSTKQKIKFSFGRLVALARRRLQTLAIEDCDIPSIVT